MDIKKIIDSLTDEQLASYIRGADSWHLFSNEELGVKKIKMSDGPHGMRTEPDSKTSLLDMSVYKSVCFPSLSLASCSFDRELIGLMGKTLAEEAKELGVNIILGPAVNIKRDPKCGRNFEYISEDPYVVGELATHYINGVQNEGIGTSIKHFACNNCETDRMVINSVVDEKALREIYLRGFETAIKNAQPQTVMASYNKVNGFYATENRHLLTEILKDEWGFKGFVVSDWTAVDNINNAVLAGMDLEMPDCKGATYKKALEGIKSSPEIKEAYKRAIARQLSVIDKSIDLNPTYTFDYEKHHQIAKKIADESIVLLKNDENILPLKENEKILFVGPLCEKPRYQGGGSSNINPFKVTSMSEIISDNLNISYLEGYRTDTSEDSEELLNQIKENAANFDKIVCFLGFNVSQESEGFDKKDLKFYENQINLINLIYDLNKNIVVVLENGSVIEIPFINKIKGLVETYLGGEAINESIYDILFGKVNPSGKLNETFAYRYEDYPSSTNFPGDAINTLYKESIFVGYRYFDTFKKPVLFPFGYGLSYTQFEFSNLRIDTNEDSVVVNLNVKNIGGVFGKEVVQIYIKNPAKPQYFSENKALKGFEKVSLHPSETKQITIKIPFETLKVFDLKSNKFKLFNGRYKLFVGNSSMDERIFASFEINSGDNDYFEYKNIEHFSNGEFDVVSNEEFSELFLDKKLPLAERDMSSFDINCSFEYAKNHGSKGAKMVIDLIESIGKRFVKKGFNPDMLVFVKTSSIRQLYMGSGGVLSPKNINNMLKILNDVHPRINLIKTLFALMKAKV